MSDNDLIRRGDATDFVLKLSADDNSSWGMIMDGLRAITAVHVTVKPLEWFEVSKYRIGGKYTAEGYTIRYIEGLWLLDFAGDSKAVWRFPTIEAAKAAAQADYDARIRSALTLTPAPDAAKVAALVVALRRQSAWVRSALDCPAWQWDEDQREVAESQHADAIAALAAMKEGK